MRALFTWGACASRVLVYLAVVEFLQGGCSLDLRHKTACVTSADCLSGWDCLNRTCVDGDAGAARQPEDAAIAGDGFRERIDAGAADHPQNPSASDGSADRLDAGASPVGDGPSERFDAAVADHPQGDSEDGHSSTLDAGAAGKDGSSDGGVDAPIARLPGARADSTSSRGPAAYKRADGSNAIVFGDSQNNVQELSLLQGGASWQLNALSGPLAAPTAEGPVSVFLQFDGTNTVTYRASNGHIWLLTLPKGSTTWAAQDLSVNRAGCPALASVTLASGPPSGYTRSDRTSAIVFRGTDSHIYEISRFHGAICWQIGDLNGVGGPPAAVDPMGFVRGDGYDSVVYADADGAPLAFSLPLGPIGSVQWVNETLNTPPPDWTLPAAADGPLRGYVRSDGVSAVVYRSAAGRIWEISRVAGEASTDPTWYAGELTVVDGAALAGSDPMPYVRADGQSAVMYADSSGNIYELALPVGSTSWSANTLSSVARTPSAVDGPMGYTRGDGTSAVVFHDLKGHIWQLKLTVEPSVQWTVLDLSVCAATPSACLNP